MLSSSASYIDNYNSSNSTGNYLKGAHSNVTDLNFLGFRGKFNNNNYYSNMLPKKLKCAIFFTNTAYSSTLPVRNINNENDFSSPYNPSYYGIKEGWINHEGIYDISAENKKSSLELEAEELFGVMRDATHKESESVNNYIDNISEDTGINFFDIC